MEQTLDPAPSTQSTAVLPSRLAHLRQTAVIIGQRILFNGIVLLAIVFLVHIAFNAATATGQGQPLLTAIGQAITQAIDHLGRLFSGDLGLSLQGTVARGRQLPVIEALPLAVSRSSGLLGVTFLLSIVIGVPLGVIAAIRRHKRGSLWILILSFIGISTPSFFAALGLQIAAIQYTRTVGQSLLPVGGFGWDKHLILPMLVLSARPVAQITRITFVALSDILNQDYVRVARSKGLRSSTILLVHALKNAAVPILTTIAVSLRFSLSSLPVVEIYFGWGGMGEVLLRAMFLRDTDMTVALLLALGLIFITINLLLEASYAIIDPRLREAPAYTEQGGDKVNLWDALQSIGNEIGRFLIENPISAWLRARISPTEAEEESPFRHALQKDKELVTAELTAEKAPGTRWGAWRQGTLQNLPLMLGSLIVITLIVMMLFGPRLAPYSPNTTQQVAMIDGTIQVPPFAPSNLHPWGTDPLGRDMLSLVLAGAQQTLILAFTVVLVRLLIGFILGVLAGWFRDSWLDRLIMGIVQAMAVFPTLLMAALLIFAFNIQAGMRTFIIALSIVGWSEVMQLMRSEVIKIRPLPFIESAVAVGQRTSRLILFHVLPNLAPALIAVAAVEVGAVLLILGELGFIGIFINGGAGSGAAAFGLFSNVPEWGSLLSNIRGWTRSYPWTGFYPMAAFFIAILGFNLLSEGLRRLVEEVGLVINRLFNRYTVTAGIALMAFFIWARTNTGAIADYRLQADTFASLGAETKLASLTAPELQGRALGSSELQETAVYIRDEFQQIGLQAGGQSMTYFQEDTRAYFALDREPSLQLEDGGGDLEFGQDYAVFPAISRNEGRASGRVRLLALGPGKSVTELDYSQDIVLLFDRDNLPRLQDMACQGVLIIAKDLSDMKRHYTHSAAEPGTGCGENTPVFWVSDRVANRLLQSNDLTVQQLSELVEDIAADEWLDMVTETTATLEISGHVENVNINNVIGHLPGTLDALDGNLILVAVQYDAPPVTLGQPYEGANDNASGIAVMLETIRTIQNSGYQPYKTFLFVAYSGEGMPDQSAAPDPRSFLEARNGFDLFDIEAVVYVRGLAGGGDEIGIWGEETSRLAKLMETASHLVNQQTVRQDGSPTMNIFGPGLRATAVDSDIPQVGFSRRGWERNARLSGDTMTFISAENMENSGRALSLGLMILGRERTY